jgi:FkbM family methyltransferase
MINITKKQYRHGLMNKHRYMEEMFNIHKQLFEYPELLKTSPVKKIEITQEGVQFCVEYKGLSMIICCDDRDAYSLPMILMNLSECENDENEMVLRLIKEEDVVFDIGANIGWYTLNILLRRKGVSVYSFEPIESSFNYLKKNLLLNNLNSDRAFNIGFSNENRTVKFYFDVNYAMASSMSNLREDDNTVEVDCEVIKLDDFVSTRPSFNKLDFIKCDVEGAELLVLQGAIETIVKYKPIIFAEMLRKWSAKFNYHPMEIINLLKGIGYRCFTIKKENLVEFITMNENTVETNFLFLHANNHITQLSQMTGNSSGYPHCHRQ